MSLLRKHRIVAYSIISVAALLALLVAGVLMYTFSKSGFLYEYGIVRQMEAKHETDFKVVDRLGRNKSGYRILVLEPKSDAKTSFAAYRYNGSHGDGGLPFWRHLNDDYKESRLYYYYPELAQKHFGTPMDDGTSYYWEAIKQNKPSDFESTMQKHFLDSYVPFEAAELDEIVSKGEAFFRDGEQYGVKELYLNFRDDRIKKDGEAGAANHYIRVKEPASANKVPLRTQLERETSRIATRYLDDQYAARYADLPGQAYASVLIDDNLTDYRVVIKTNPTVKDVPVPDTLYAALKNVKDFGNFTEDFNLKGIAFEVSRQKEDNLKFSVERDAFGGIAGPADLERLLHAAESGQ